MKPTLSNDRAPLFVIHRAGGHWHVRYDEFTYVTPHLLDALLCVQAFYYAARVSGR